MDISTAFLDLPNEEGRLYYEIRGSNDAPKKLVMVMGFGATLRGFDELADFLVQTDQFQVLTFDNRGAGQSEAKPIRQTTTLLAQDTLKILDHIGWTLAHSTSLVHVYGASMGGMIAQELAILLIHRKKIASLFLAVTCRQRYPIRPAFGPNLYSIMLSSFANKPVDDSVKEMLPICFSKWFLDQIHDSSSDPNSEVEAIEVQETNREFYFRKFKRDWDTVFSFKLSTLSSQTSAIVTHKLQDWKKDLIQQSGIPVTVQIAEEDLAMPTHLQHELGHFLNAKIISFPGGHLESSIRDRQAYRNALLTHFGQ